MGLWWFIPLTRCIFFQDFILFYFSSRVGSLLFLFLLGVAWCNGNFTCFEQIGFMLNRRKMLWAYCLYTEYCINLPYWCIIFIPLMTGHNLTVLLYIWHHLVLTHLHTDWCIQGKSVRWLSLLKNWGWNNKTRCEAGIFCPCWMQWLLRDSVLLF